MINKQLVLKNRPKGHADENTWDLLEKEMPTPKEGEILIETHYISLDPAMRGWLNNSRSYIEPVAIDAVMRAGSIGKVIESKNPKFKVDDTVTGWGGVQQYYTTDGSQHYKVDTTHVAMPTYIGTLGMPGMTAYFGILNVGKLKEGDRVLVSGAAGAVGSVVGQIAKIKGCTVVGIAGGKEKCDYLVNELGYDAAIDYKNGSLLSQIKQTCPKGIDVYFDNVGGEILDAALIFLRRNARVVICGAISQYNETKVAGPKNYLSLLVNRASMKGMVVFDYADKYGEAAHQMGQWIAEGKLQAKEDIYEGIENFLPTYERLFTGNKLGKLVLKVKD